jgi:hypothetical protein
MDIHKPKPWHGLREFLKEYLIIVVGVLTALGGEQAVELVHRQQEVGEAREALREEMVADATLLKLDLEEVPCVQARLDRITAWANGGEFPPVNMGLAGTELSASAWDEAKAAAVSRMPLKQRIAYDKFYAAVRDRNETTHDERVALSNLGRYMAQPHVPPEERVRALEDVAYAKLHVVLVAGYDRSMLDQAKAMGASPGAYDKTRVNALVDVCGRPPSAPAPSALKGP